jgi:beta-ribofuranosylaminobenzene 5'-phosphate synthase
MTIIKAYPRIHIGLADMGFASPRCYGGVGFTLEQPATVVRVKPWSDLALTGFESIDCTSRDELYRIIRDFSQICKVNFKIELVSMPPQHHGYGTKTTLLLAVLAALSSASGHQLSRNDMQLLSGRGGASGIGIHAFFEGGVIWDAGHSRRAVQSLEPSGIRHTSEIPLMMARIDFPDHWAVKLIELKGKRISGEIEAVFFSDNTPVPQSEALSTIATLYHGVLPAFKGCDLEELASALRYLHQIGFKKRELLAQESETQELLNELQEGGFAAGMSSIGPLVYVIFEKNDTLSEHEIDNIICKFDSERVIVVHPRNSGYEIIEDDIS